LQKENEEKKKKLFIDIFFQSGFNPSKPILIFIRKIKEAEVEKNQVFFN
jgi:hypothetical protein